MGQVKTPGQVVREALYAAEVAREAFYAAEDAWAAVAQAVLDADPVRTQALALVESLALMLAEWHDDFYIRTNHMPAPLIDREAKLVADAREFVCKAREASKP